MAKAAISRHLPSPPSWMFTNESEAYDSASVGPIHTGSELSSDSDSAYDSASVASVASVNQPEGGSKGFLAARARANYTRHN